MKHIHPLALSLCLLATACTTTDPPAPAPKHLGPPMASTDAPDPADDTAQAIASGDVQTGAAVGLLTTPAAITLYKWVGQALLQLIINTKIDVKVDASADTHKDHK